MEPWLSAATNGGAFLVLVGLLVVGGRFAMRQVERSQRSREKHDAAVLEVLAEIRDSLHRVEVERIKAVAELRAEIERVAKETRHDVRNHVQRLVSELQCPADGAGKVGIDDVER